MEAHRFVDLLSGNGGPVIDSAVEAFGYFDVAVLIGMLLLVVDACDLLH